MKPKKNQAKKVETKSFNARLPKEIHTQAMVYRAKTGMSLQAQVLAGLALLYAQRRGGGGS